MRRADLRWTPEGSFELFSSNSLVGWLSRLRAAKGTARTSFLPSSCSAISQAWTHIATKLFFQWQQLPDFLFLTALTLPLHLWRNAHELGASNPSRCTSGLCPADSGRWSSSVKPATFFSFYCRARSLASCRIPFCSGWKLRWAQARVERTWCEFIQSSWHSLIFFYTLHSSGCIGCRPEDLD